MVLLFGKVPSLTSCRPLHVSVAGDSFPTKHHSRDVAVRSSNMMFNIQGSTQNKSIILYLLYSKIITSQIYHVMTSFKSRFPTNQPSIYDFTPPLRPQGLFKATQVSYSQSVSPKKNPNHQSMWLKSHEIPSRFTSRLKAAMLAMPAKNFWISMSWQWDTRVNVKNHVDNNMDNK